MGDWGGWFIMSVGVAMGIVVVLWGGAYLVGAARGR